MVTNKLYLDDRNNEYIVLCKFVSHTISGCRVTVVWPPKGSPQSWEAKKSPVWIGLTYKVPAKSIPMCSNDDEGETLSSGIGLIFCTHNPTLRLLKATCTSSHVFFGLPNSLLQGWKYVLIDWVGGPDGKIFGSRSWRTGPSAARSVRHDREPNIFLSGPTKLSQ